MLGVEAGKGCGLFLLLRLMDGQLAGGFFVDAVHGVLQRRQFQRVALGLVSHHRLIAPGLDLPSGRRCDDSTGDGDDDEGFPVHRNPPHPVTGSRPGRYRLPSKVSSCVRGEPCDNPKCTHAPFSWINWSNSTPLGVNTEAIDTLGKKLGHAALTTFVRLCPEVRSASSEQLEQACAAMRAKSRQVIDQLIEDGKDAPWIFEMAYADAVLTLAQEGVRVLRQSH